MEEILNCTTQGNSSVSDLSDRELLLKIYEEVREINQRMNCNNISEQFITNHKLIPIDVNGKSYVDLGLPSGTKWARTNVGATVETDAGLYFAWGETTGYTSSQVGTDKNFSWSDYELGDGQSGAAHMTKYNSTDGKTTLDLEDDAAHVNMGGDWHMPSKEQINELQNNTKNGWVAANGTFTLYDWNGTDYGEQTGTTASLGNKFGGVTGFVYFKSDASDYSAALESGEYLFIPASGVCLDRSVHYVGDVANVWSQSVYENYLDYAWFFVFDDEEVDLSISYRCYGYSVRGVVGRYSLDILEH